MTLHGSFFCCENKVKSWSRSFWNDPIINEIRLIFNFEFGNSGIMSNIEGIIWTKINFARRFYQKAFFEFKLAEFEPINANFAIFCWNYYIFSSDNKIKDFYCVLYHADPLTRDPGLNRSEIFKFLLVLVRSQVLKFFSVLVRAGPEFLEFAQPYSGPWFLNFAGHGPVLDQDPLPSIS